MWLIDVPIVVYHVRALRRTKKGFLVESIKSGNKTIKRSTIVEWRNFQTGSTTNQSFLLLYPKEPDAMEVARRDLRGVNYNTQPTSLRGAVDSLKTFTVCLYTDLVTKNQYSKVQELAFLVKI